MLKELGSDEQPSSVKFEKIAFWVRIYDLPSGARKGKIIHQIAGKCGEVVEIEEKSLEGISRSARARIYINPLKPLK